MEDAQSSGSAASLLPDTGLSATGNHNDNGITPAAAYRKKVRDDWRLRLPSGATFLVRKADIFWYAENAGGLPTGLIEKSRLAQNPGSGSPPADIPLTEEEQAAYRKWQRKLVCASVLEPRVVDRDEYQGADEGVLFLDEIDTADLEFIFRYLTGQVTRDGRDLQTFPGKRLAGGAGPDGPDVRAESK